jgi:hypothetical protein
VGGSAAVVSCVDLNDAASIEATEYAHLGMWLADLEARVTALEERGSVLPMTRWPNWTIDDRVRQLELAYG